MTSFPKLIYYYQSFSTIKNLIDLKLKNVHIYVSSIHFGKDDDNKPYIHLNDESPYIQTTLWNEMQIASNNDINIMIMLGGAGGAYTTLFQNFNSYYSLLKSFIKKYPFIKGIDLDIEEYVDLDNVKLLIRTLNKDFGDNFIITMAPVEFSMISNEPGMGGFKYKDIINSKEGEYINWFNVQCYGSFSFETYQQIINNGYNPENIVMGMLGDDYNPNNFDMALSEIKKVLTSYPKIGGFCLWEYGDTTIPPLIWGKKIENTFENINKSINNIVVEYNHLWSIYIFIYFNFLLLQMFYLFIFF